MNNKYKLSAATLSAVLIGGGLYFYEPEKPPEVEQKKIVESKPVQGFGVIDFERIKSKHPDGAELKELIGREKRLKLELEAALTPYKPPQREPEFEEKPFDESAREKNMQQVMEKFSALKAKKVRLAEEFTNDSREEYLRRRNAVRSVYLNAALNITLKLQNADNLRLTEEEIKKLQSDLEELTQERNAKQKEMLDEWTAEINSKVEQATAEEESKARAEAKQLREQSTVDAEKKVAEVQARNKALTEKINSEIESRQKRRQELLEEIQEVSKKREELENKILDSIVENVGKLATIYKLEAVFVKAERENSIKNEELKIKNDNANLILNSKFLISNSKGGGVIYFNKNAKDITKDLIKEMELKGVTAE